MCRKSLLCLGYFVFIDNLGLCVKIHIVMPKNNPKLNTTIMVYIDTFDSDTVVGEVEPAIRNELIQSCTDKLAKLQRYCVWQLFDHALHECYDGGTADFNFYVDDNGKWNCHNGIEFSLAHSNNVVAVAVCNHYVGVDIEAVDRFTHLVDNDSFLSRVLTDNEINLLNETPTEHKAEVLATMWTKKESFYKLQSRRVFNLKSFDMTVLKCAYSQILTIDGVQYALSVSRYIPSKIEIVWRKHG